MTDRETSPRTAATGQAADVAPGRRVAGRYDVLSQLGAGGMGAVFLARDTRLDRDVAVKVLHPQYSTDAGLVERFEREAKVIAGLRHPGIIGVHDLLHLEGGTLAIILEYVPGHSLQDEIDRGTLSWRRCADVGAQVCDALAAAHAKGVIHRDIKPANVLIEPDGTARVADFGIARLLSDATATSGQLIGTPAYMAPEVVTGGAASPQSDLYGVGVMLYRAVTGTPPFRSEEGGFVAAMANVIQPVPDPRDQVPDLPEAAAAIIVRALSKEPAGRYASGAAMASALRASAGIRGPEGDDTEIDPGPGATRLVGDPNTPSAGTPATPRAATGGRGRRVARVLVPVAAAAVAVAAGLLVASNLEAEPEPVPEAQRVRAGTASVEVPGGWTSQAAGSVPGLAMADAVTARPPSGEGRMVVGTIDGEGPTLLPAAFREQVGADLPEPEAVRLGNLEAYRYAGLPAGAGASDMDLFVVPTNRGVTAVACDPAGTDTAQFMTACAGAANTLRLAGARGVGLGPDPAYAERLRGTFADLGTARGRGRTALARAGTPAAQAAAATRLAAAYRAAAGDLAPARPGPQAEGLNEDLVAALRAAAAAYSALAGAARADDTSAYAAARTRVSEAETRVRRAAAALEPAGYQVA